MKQPDIEKMAWEIAIALLNSPEGKRALEVNKLKGEDYDPLVRRIVNISISCIKKVTGVEPEVDQESMTQHIIEEHITGEKFTLNRRRIS
ncbi:MAG TPA: hypothetical protein V6D27_01085 [Vampirovibrionales bacterium]